MRKSVITRSAVAMTTGLVVLSIASGAGPAIVVGQPPAVAEAEEVTADAPEPVALAEGCAWSIQNLPSPAGEGLTQAIGADGRGRIVGEGDKSGVVTWERGVLTVVGHPNGLTSTDVKDVNAAGTIVGTALDANARAHRAYSLKAGKFTVLPVPAGFTDSGVTAINGRGDILGSVSDSVSHSAKAVVWRAGQPVTLGIDERATPEDIDDDGTILLNRESGPALWNDGAERPLDLPEGLNGVRATAIRGGKVVGYGLPQEFPARSSGDEFVPQAYAQALIWVDGKPGELPSGTTASEINANGLVVGNAGQGREAVKHPVVWTDTAAEAAELGLPDGGNGYVNGIGDENTATGAVDTKPVSWQCR
ncbi:hypothetical protein AB5J62_13930 [Amycolatopsis sp. cg5]|uniref:hypothetical protein n=1 Tax=Amycolatopsis sp. cg5 TaxID=3238802 RepID=UPI003526B8CC